MFQDTREDVFVLVEVIFVVGLAYSIAALVADA